MIRFFLLFILTSVTALASVQLRLDISQSVVKQGSLVDAVVTLESGSDQQIELQKLSGLSLADTIYIYQVASLAENTNSAVKAKIIFLKLPAAQPLIHKIGETEISVSWSPVEIQPTEQVKELIFGTFEVPSRTKMLQWMIALISGLFLLFLCNKIRLRIKKKKSIKRLKTELKNKLLSAKNYSEVVLLWQQKELFLKEFPALAESFKEMEKVLFKYQFKSSQNELEKAEVMKAYQSFITNSNRGFNGI